MEAIVLAGGFGTRLKSVVSDLPKPMAPIGNKPFLTYLLEFLHRHNIEKVILSTGYKHAQIEEYFKESYKNISIVYSIEDEPLGTGGGIKKALEKVSDSQVFILNGDTFFDVNLMELYNKHVLLDSTLTLSLKQMKHFNRYGSVITSGDRIIKFVEKQYKKSGFINGGIYLASSKMFDQVKLPKKFSFETDFMEEYINQMNINAYVSDGYFIDIGIPEDYKTAQIELGKHI